MCVYIIVTSGILNRYSCWVWCSSPFIKWPEQGICICWRCVLGMHSYRQV